MSGSLIAVVVMAAIVAIGGYLVGALLASIRQESEGRICPRPERTSVHRRPFVAQSKAMNATRAKDDDYDRGVLDRSVSGEPGRLGFGLCMRSLMLAPRPRSADDTALSIQSGRQPSNRAKA